MQDTLSIPISLIDFENRLGAEVNVRAERRGERLLLIIEPGRTAGGIHIIPTDKLDADVKRLLRQ
jgi:hypothetical protein